VAFLVLLPSCIFANGKPPEADVNVQVASQYNFRGQVMTDYPVLQTDASLRLPTKDGGTAVFRAFGNLDLTDHTGEAWMPNDGGGEFTEIDLSAAYARQVGGIDLSAGVVHYSWAEGDRFTFTPFPPTTEVFVRVGGEVAGFLPALTVHRDVDEAGGFYVRAELGRDVALLPELHLLLLGWQGFSDADHSQWLYRTHDNALADLGGSAILAWDLEPGTQLRFGIAGSTIVDNDLRNWFHGKVDPDNVWFTIGISWRL
jgi:hypothetical protein